MDCKLPQEYSISGQHRKIETRLKHSPFYLAIPTAPAAENRDAPQSD
jgi:hypothetical protein